MKKKIIIGLVVFSLIFLVSGIYIVSTIEHATTRLDNLIRLHQVELLREHLLIQIKRAQSDLYLKNTRYARNMDTVVTHVRAMSGEVNACFGCHHTKTVTNKLDHLKNRIEEYKNALSRVFTLRANRTRLEAEEDNAFQIGTELITELKDITAMTNIKLEERTAAAFSEIKQSKFVLYALVAIVPLIALGLSALFIRGVTGPLAELITATRRLKAGNLNYRIKGLQDEFGEVASSFNEMADSLKEQCLRMQWAEQIVILGELAGGLAHEMKNPLAGIKAFIEVLSEDQSLTRENREALLMAAEQIKRIELLLKSLMNFARPPKPQFMLTDITSVLDSTVSLAMKHPLYLPGVGRNITVRKEYDPRIPGAMADPLQLQQVFMNLLLNAADALPRGGTVTARTSYNESARVATVTISDTGTGVDAAVIDKIFQPFFTTKPKGTGLGLSISKRLIEQHGGDIWAGNNPDQGVSFTIVLPVRRECEAAA